jgi:hypothetical protein
MELWIQCPSLELRHLRGMVNGLGGSTADVYLVECIGWRETGPEWGREVPGVDEMYEG